MAKQNRLAVSRAQQKAEKLLQKNELPAAQLAYQKLCQLAPDNHQAWLNLGMINGMLGDLAAAETALQQALSLKSDLPQAHYNLGHLAVERRQWSVAEKHQRAYVRSRPDDLRELRSVR